MIAIFIDARNKKVEQIEINKPDDVRAAVSGDAELAATLFDGDVVFVAEDGFQRFDHFFALLEGDYEQPLAGCGVVIGIDPEGNPSDCLYTVADIEKRVAFMNRAEVVGWINARRPYDRNNGYTRFH